MTERGRQREGGRERGREGCRRGSDLRLSRLFCACPIDAWLVHMIQAVTVTHHGMCFRQLREQLLAFPIILCVLSMFIEFVPVSIRTAPLSHNE